MYIPTTKQLTDSNVANFEVKIGQEVPLLDVAFVRVLSAILALQQTTLYKYLIDRSRAAIVKTAAGTDLDNLGAEYGIYRVLPVAAELEIVIEAVDDTVIPSTATFTADLSGLGYQATESAVAAGGIVTLNIGCVTTGAAGTLSIGSTLTLDNPIPGASNTATVTAIIIYGVDPEADDAYRDHILSRTRGSVGGGSAADYRVWAQEAAGVLVAYPYAGKPFDSVETSYPGDRTIYIQATTAIDPDGIAPPELLAAVREIVSIDPQTSEGRPPLGLIDATLYVESIVRNPYYVQIRNAAFLEGTATQVQAVVEAAIVDYFGAVRPYVDGVDYLPDRNDTLTQLSLAEIVQEVLAANGATAEQVLFGPGAAVFVPKKILNPNELIKLGGVEYAYD